jgi:cell division septation protein DedD
MKNKDFREIQVSSSLLVVIFLGVLALGVFIFLLGVSVGKKQVRIASPTQVVTQQIPEPVKEPPVEPTPAETEAAKTPALSGGTPSQRQTAEAASKPRAKDVAAKPQKAPAGGSGLYFVQIGAFTERAQAQAFSETYKKQGYTVVVAEPRPTDTKTQYRVRLGGYTSRDRAADLLNKLNAAAGKKTDYFVVRD